jgi:capsular polysaccharide transport system ATP-binding protein
VIELDRLCKTFVMRGKRKVIADNISVLFPQGVSVAILGRNGAGKSSLLKMIAGTMNPDAGTIRSNGTISWPVGYAGSFHPELTGLQNIRFVARIYGVDTDELVDFVQRFAELGAHFNLPVSTYSSGMRSRLAFGASMGIHFDTYLVDEITAVGDAAFRRKSDEMFTERLTRCSAIMVTHGLDQARKLCQHAAVLEAGQLTYFTDVAEGIEFHQDQMKRAG